MAEKMFLAVAVFLLRISHCLLGRVGLENTQHAGFLKQSRVFCLSGLQFKGAFLSVVLMLFALVPAALPRCSAALPVVVEGEARAVIVQNSTASRVGSLAASELQTHIEAITGAKLPVVRAEDWKREDGITAIIIGSGQLLEEFNFDPGNLPREGFRIRSLPEYGVVVLAGRDTGNPMSTARMLNRAYEFGSLYASYELLERWGVRWLFPGEIGTVIPLSDTLEIHQIDLIDGPDFKMRNLWVNASRADGSAATLRDQDPEAIEARLWSLRNRSGNSTDKYHTRHHSPRWWDLWAEDNLEYLGLYRGQRAWRRNPPADIPDSMPRRSKPCVSNPGVSDGLAELAINAFRQSPRRSYSICEQDGTGGFCTCPDCLALDVLEEGELPYGSSPEGIYAQRSNLTDRYMFFWNRVAEQVYREFPDRYLGVYIYSVYTDLPRGDWEMHPMLRGIYVNNGQVDPVELARRLEGWSRLSPNPIGLYIPAMFGAWPSRDFARLTLPVMTFGNVYEGLLFCRDHEITGFRGNPNFRADNVGSHGVMAYAYARWLWNADNSPEDVLADFCRHAFGPAAEPMLDYFNALERRQNLFPIKGVLHRAGFDDWLEHHLSVFTPNFVRRLRLNLEEAMGLAGNDDQRGRIKIFRQNLDFSAAQVELERIWLAFKSGKAGIGEVVAAYDKCGDLYSDLSAENRPLRPLYRRGDGSRAAALAKYYDVLNAFGRKNWEMRADPYTEGVAQSWYSFDSEGGWRPVDMVGYDLQGLYGNDVIVWFRKKFYVPEDMSTDNMGVGFRVNNTSADVFLNGEPIGRQILGEGEYVEPRLDGDGHLVSGQALAGDLPYVYDISSVVRPGEVNEFVVKIWGYTDRGVGYHNLWLVRER